MKIAHLIVAALLALPAVASAAGDGCQDTSGPLALEKIRAGAVGAQQTGCINRSLETLSAVIVSSPTIAAATATVAALGVSTNALAVAVAAKVAKAGDTMTGALNISGGSTLFAPYFYVHGLSNNAAIATFENEDNTGSNPGVRIVTKSNNQAVYGLQIENSAGAGTHIFLPNGTYTATGQITAAQFNGPLSGNATTATALAANPSDAASGYLARGIQANGTVEPAWVETAGTSGSTNPVTSGALYTHNTSAGAHASGVAGNAATATALAANGTNAGSGRIALGVDASGNAETGGVDSTAISGSTSPVQSGALYTHLNDASAHSTGISGNAATATALAANPTDAGSGFVARGIQANGTVELARVDPTAVNGSTNPIQSDGVFDGFALKLDSPTVSGTVGNVLKLASNGGTEWGTGGGGGTEVNIISSFTAGYMSGTTVINYDDTIPQLGAEGFKIVTATITATNASSVIDIFIQVCAAYTASAAERGSLCVWKDATQDALACAPIFVPNPGCETFYLKTVDVAGDTSSHVYTVKLGTNDGDTMAINNYGGGRILGGAIKSGIVLTEIAP